MLEKSIQNYQIATFPKMRRIFADRAKESLWESDVDVIIGGNRNDTISFIGGIYAANKNKKDTHDGLLTALELLRFKQDRYYWYKDSEYTSWTLKTPNDSDLVRTFPGDE